MNLVPDEAQRAALAAAREAAHTLLGPDAADLDASHAFPTETLKALGRAGLMGVNVDPAYGGRGAGAVAYALAVRELAAACAGTTVGMMVTNMVAEAIEAYGDDAQKAQHLPRITGGEYAAAAFSLSEPGSGSDAASLRTVATRDGDDYVLDGTKAWVTSGGHAGVYLVMAATDPAARARGISAFLVEPGTPGFEAAKPEHKMGQHASATTELVFDQCRVPASARLGPEGIGFKIAMRALDGGRVGVSAQACGVATGALAMATGHLASLDAEAQGPDHAAHLAALADAATALDAAWLMCLRAAWLKDEKRPFTREAAMSKLFCTETAGRVCEAALRILGPDAYGANAVSQALRDVRVTRIYEGTSEVQRIVIAREVLRAASAAA